MTASPVSSVHTLGVLTWLAIGLSLAACDVDLGVGERRFACDPAGNDCLDGYRCVRLLQPVAGAERTGHCLRPSEPVDCEVYLCTAPPGDTTAPDTTDAGDIDGCDGATCADTSGCTGGLSSCEGQCVDTDTSRAHCGGCGQTCPLGTTCLDGQCRCGDSPQPCDANQVCCQGACVAQGSDACKCGESEMACTNSELCCASPGGVEACVDPAVDVGHCGGCGRVCPDGAECAGETCRCPDSEQPCPSDPAHTTSVGCNQGTCLITCEPDWRDCDGEASNGCEIPDAGSLEHCGGCNQACGPTAAACVDARCDPIVEIAAGELHTCARRASGRVVCWGDNRTGAVGAGIGVETVETPTLVVTDGDATLEGVVDIDASATRTCALTDDARVLCWGDDQRRATVDPAGAGLEATQIAVGDGFVCAVGGAQPLVSCWGVNDEGQLGNGSNMASDTPVAVSGLPEAHAIKVVARSDHACALVEPADATADAAIYCWGDNSSGAVGSGVDTAVRTPIALDLASPPTAVATSLQHTCATTTAGAVWCWGNNQQRQTAPPPTDDSTCSGSTRCLAPVEVAGTCEAPEEVATGRLHTCVVCGDGAVECWGFDASGQLGDGTVGGDAGQSWQPPTALSTAVDALHLVAGSTHTCLVDALTDRVLCWGEGSRHRLGNGSDSLSATALPVLELP